MAAGSVMVTMTGEDAVMAGAVGMTSGAVARAIVPMLFRYLILNMWLDADADAAMTAAIAVIGKTLVRVTRIGGAAKVLRRRQ